MQVERNPQEAQRDVFAFWALTTFVVFLFVVPAEWIPALEKARPALLTSGVAAALMLIRRVGKREPLLVDGVRGLSLLAVVGLSIASVSWSVHPENSRATAIELVKLAAIYITLVNVVSSPKRATIIAGAVVLASIVTSVGVINWWRAGVDMVEGFRSRWVGVYADPNHMAMDLGLVIPLALAFILRKESSIWMRVLCAVAAGLALTAIVLSHSRGGFLGLCAGLAVWALRERRHRITTFALGGVLALGLLVLAPSSFWERNETVTSFEQDASAMGRVHAWEVAGKMSMDRPLLGVGVGGFRFAWPLYAPPGAERAYVAHNIFLDVVGELGWIGLAFFLVFVGGTAACAFEASRSPSVGWLARGLSAAIVGYIVCDLFSGYILSTHFYLLFGLASCVHRMAAMEPETSAVEAPREERSGALAWGA